MGRRKEEKKATEFLATYFPLAGSPVDILVKADENGVIEWEGKSWVCAPNSAWISGGKRRIILPEGLAQSVNGGYFANRAYMTCRLFFLFMKINVLEAMFQLQNRKPWYKTGQTWIIAGALALIAMILVWMVVSNGKELSAIGEALRQLLTDNQTGNGGHNDIAPNNGV